MMGTLNRPSGACSVVLAASTSGSSAPASGSPGNAKAIPTREPCSGNTGPTSPAIPTSASLPKPTPLTSSRVDSHVRTSARRAIASESMAHAADSGGSLLDSLAYFDPDSCSWKTSQQSLLMASDVFSGILPASGTMRSGRLYPRAAWVRHTCDAECSLWPTPLASSDTRGFGIPNTDKTGGRYRRSTILRVRALTGEHGWKIHPHFTEALMGFPIDWSAIEDSATPSSRKSRNGSGGNS
jgi:hypothetical protein